MNIFKKLSKSNITTNIKLTNAVNKRKKMGANHPDRLAMDIKIKAMEDGLKAPVPVTSKYDSFEPTVSKTAMLDEMLNEEI